MQYKRNCNCCGHSLTAYTHRLNKPLVKALRELVDFYEDNREMANLQKDLKLTKNQYNNFQKLQYFDLVRRVETLGWIPTKKGLNFVHGLEPCMTTVATFGKEILKYDHIAWQTHKGTIESKYIGDIDETSYKRRTEYKEEKQDRLF